MTDRKTYSRRREEILSRVVDKAIVDLRILILRGGMEGHNYASKERIVIRELGALPDLVTAAYRRKLVEPKEIK